jgi:hypothetical protein
MGFAETAHSGQLWKLTCGRETLDLETALALPESFGLGGNVQPDQFAPGGQ